MTIGQVSEIFVNDPNSNFEVAPSSVTVVPYFGVPGKRGTYIIPGLGNPTTYDFEESYIIGANGQRQYIAPQPLDWFLNLRPTDPGYLSVYQLDVSGTEWNKIFKLIPNVYNQNFVGDFDEGQILKTISVPKESLLLDQKFGSNFNFENLDINLDVDIESEFPTAVGFTLISAVENEDNYQFSLSITAAEGRKIDGVPTVLQVSGERIVHLSVSVI